MKTFTLYWLNGKRQVLEGTDIADAVNCAGYGAGAIRALDFYADGDDKSYQWDAQKHDWVKVPELQDAA